MFKLLNIKTMKKFYTLILSLFLLAGLFFPYTLKGQQDKEKGYVFRDVKKIQTTSVKNQYSTGTCWSFATTSFIETELIRMGKGELDLSEMYAVRNSYVSKAINYIRFHGKANFSQGGQAHDVLNSIRKYGMITEEVYPGLNYGEEKHVHGELAAVLNGMLEGVVKNLNRKLTPVWQKAFNSILDVYLGEMPENFTFEGKDYTPVTFCNELGFKPDDYAELTSYLHHSFHSTFSLEVPDNWTYDLYYNLPIDELIKVIDYALDNGYSVCWDGDVGEKGFSHKNKLAIIPEKDWSEMSEEETKEIFTSPAAEKKITQEMRQETFDNYTTTDDHLMHIVGTARDERGTKYYLTKNSWGEESNELGGFLYMSEAYVKLKTLAIMVHKDAIPKYIADKLGIYSSISKLHPRISLLSNLPNTSKLSFVIKRPRSFVSTNEQEL
jgi:bleomycin hydrolase